MRGVIWPNQLISETHLFLLEIWLYFFDYTKSNGSMRFPPRKARFTPNSPLCELYRKIIQSLRADPSVASEGIRRPERSEPTRSGGFPPRKARFTPYIARLGGRLQGRTHTQTKVISDLLVRRLRLSSFLTIYLRLSSFFLEELATPLVQSKIFLNLLKDFPSI
jgi:hypothetical protein